MSLPTKTKTQSPPAGPAADSDAPLLAIEDLRTWFDTPQGIVHAVDGVDLTLERGKTLALVGESGSGKSVLGRSVMGILGSHALTPTGSVRIDGRELRGKSRKELRGLWGPVVSMVFQDPLTSLNPVRRLDVQLTEGMAVHLPLSKADRLARAVDLLRRVGIPEPERRLRMYPHELSGGMRQRVGIAIALACKPRLLIADEPTTALDVTIQRQILDLLAELQDLGGMGMILITHNLGVAAGRSDDIAVMYAGQIIEKGPTKNVFKHTRHPYTSALLGSLPRLEDPPHSTLAAPPGRPPVVVDPPRRCRFAERCSHAQARCLSEAPTLDQDTSAGTSVACFFPVGTGRGTDALKRNQEAGRTAAGLAVERSVA